MKFYNQHDSEHKAHLLHQYEKKHKAHFTVGRRMKKLYNWNYKYENEHKTHCYSQYGIQNSSKFILTV